MTMGMVTIDHHHVISMHSVCRTIFWQKQMVFNSWFYIKRLL